MQLVSVGLQLLEEPADAGKLPVSVVDQPPLILAELAIGSVRVEAMPTGSLEQLALVPAPRAWVHGSTARRRGARGVRHHARSS